MKPHLKLSITVITVCGSLLAIWTAGLAVLTVALFLVAITVYKESQPRTQE